MQESTRCCGLNAVSVGANSPYSSSTLLFLRSITYCHIWSIVGLSLYTNDISPPFFLHSSTSGHVLVFHWLSLHDLRSTADCACAEPEEVCLESFLAGKTRLVDLFPVPVDLRNRETVLYSHVL